MCVTDYAISSRVACKQRTTWTEEFLWQSYSLALGLPKTTLRFNDCLEWLTELRKVVTLMHYSYSEGYGSKWVKEKGTYGGVQERPGARFQMYSLGGVTWIALNSPGKDRSQHVWNIVSQHLVSLCHVLVILIMFQVLKLNNIY